MVVGCLASGSQGPLCGAEPESNPPTFEVGFGQRDITPPPGLPMWGYGARHDMLAKGCSTRSSPRLL